LEGRTLLAALTTNASAYDPAQVLIQFEPGYNPVGKLPGAARVDEALPLAENLFVVDVPIGWTVPQLLGAVKSNRHVLFAQPDYEVSINLTPDDPLLSSEWGLHNTGQGGGLVDADIDGPEAWDTSTGSGSVIVAVIDTGIDYNHPDLIDNIWTNAGEIADNGRDDDGNGFIDDVHGFNFVANTGNALDDNSHGTHVAGTIGAVGNNGIGVAGVAFGVQLMAVKFLNSAGSGSTSNAIKALDYAVAQGASISNNSWGGGGFNSALSSAINSARAAGHIFVAAAGNNGANNDTTPFYPSSHTQDNVVAVAATDRYDSLASFSNYGATSVDLAAPGVSIYSTLPGGGYGYKSGTSMATPFVTGALAMVWDVHPDWTYSEVISQVLGSVDVLPTLSGKMVTGGRLNLASAVGNPPIPPVPPSPPPPTLSVSGVSRAEGDAGTTEFSFTVNLSASSTDTVSVNFATASGSAAAGSDYASQIGTLTFDPGETSQDVTIVVSGDTAYESDETFFVNLSGPENATIATGQATGIILNDDPAPIKISIANLSLAEGNAGTTSFEFTVSLSEPSTSTVTVDFATAGGSALAGSDYVSQNDTLTFDPGVTSQTITVLVNGDTAFEPNETFLVNLTNATVGIVIADDQAVGTIVNDDSAPLASVLIDDVTQSLARGASNFVFTVALAEASTQTVTVNYATANGTLSSPGGYNASSGTLTFTPGQTSQTITIKVKKGNPGQYFYVNLTNPTNGIFIDAQGIGTIAASGAVASLSPPADSPPQENLTPSARSKPAVPRASSMLAAKSDPLPPVLKDVLLSGLSGRQIDKDAVDLLVAMLDDEAQSVFTAVDSNGNS